MSRYRNFCFTINNFTEEDIEGLKKLDFHYLVGGEETGESGTLHLQGYCELKRQYMFTALKKAIPRAHIEARRGKQVDAIKYCKKDGKVILEEGEPRHQGFRSDLDKVRETALESGMREVTALYNHQQISVAQKFLTYNEEPRDWKPEVIWLHGKSGVGKSRRAREICPEDCYTKNDGTKWWDGYDIHENVIIDDFRGSWWTLTYLLGLIDRYAFQVEVKGGYRQFKPKTIVITSIKHPKECYKDQGEPMEQLLRRLDRIENLSEDKLNEIDFFPRTVNTDCGCSEIEFVECKKIETIFGVDVIEIVPHEE